MADTIKIGNLDISSFKVGGADCSIYLGGTKLYPSEEPTPTPTPTYEWKQYNVGDTTIPNPADSKFCYGIKFGYPNTSNIENAGFLFTAEENGNCINIGFDTETSKWISAYIINEEPVDIDLSRYYNETEECYVIYFSDFGLGGMLMGTPRDILEYGPIQLYEEVTPTSN